MAILKTGGGDLNEVGGDDGQFRLRAGQPDSFDDEVPRGQLGVKNQVVGDGASAAESEDVAILQGHRTVNRSKMESQR